MPAGDFFGRGVAPMSSPFSAYMNPKTMTQQAAANPNWGNVGARPATNPFGGNQGDISEKGWTNPVDLFTMQAEREMAKMAGQPMAGVPMGGAPGGLSANNPTQYDQYFVQAAQEMSARYGVNLDPALLKAMGHIESGGTFDNSLARDDGFGDGLSVGIMQVKPSIWQHLVPDANPYDPLGNIRLGAAIMAQSIKQYGSWEAALTNVYFPTDDPNGTTQSAYVNQARQYMQQYSDGTGGLTAGGGNASSVIQTATSFVGKVPYVWGGIPGKGQQPTGWDCSGFTYWLDQNYGSGDLPMGSHYQYQYAQQTGRLKTGANQLQAGDLVFFDTGLRGGGGANLNGASHVGMYIGNGQFVHAANPGAGTIISDLNQYMAMYPFLGGMTMSWSGGGGYSAPMQGGSATYGYGSGSLFGNWASLTDPNAAWRTYKR